MTKTETPPPGAVFELAERAVEYVRSSLRITLDYQPETLPVLDHYLTGVPREGAPEADAAAEVPEPTALAALIAAAAGAYFGEVVRRTLGGTWTAEGEVAGWELTLPGEVRFSPVGVAAEAIHRGDVDGYDGGFDVSADDRDLVEQVLAERSVPVDEFYSLSGRLETLTTVVELVVARRAEAAATTPTEGEDEASAGPESDAGPDSPTG